MTIVSKEFKDMSASDIYDVLQLRSEVFIMEQEILCQDLDDVDRDAWHCCIRDDGGRAIATCRVFMNDGKYAKIGRVATAKSVRGTGVGRMIMDEAIRVVEMQFGKVPIMIHAQSYAVGFYEKFGFRISSEEFLEEGILHHEMIREPSE